MINSFINFKNSLISVCYFGVQYLVSRLVLDVELHGHRDGGNTVSFTPNGELLVSSSNDLDIRLWNWVSNEGVLTYPSGHYINVVQARVMLFSDDRIIVTCGADGQVC